MKLLFVLFTTLSVSCSAIAERETSQLLTNLLEQVNDLQVKSNFDKATVHSSDANDAAAKAQAEKINAIAHVVADLRAKLEAEQTKYTADQVALTKKNDGLVKQKQMHIVTLNAKIQRAKSEMKPLQEQVNELDASTKSQISMLLAVKKLVGELNDVNGAADVVDKKTKFDHSQDAKRTAEVEKHYKVNTAASPASPVSPKVNTAASPASPVSPKVNTAASPASPVSPKVNTAASPASPVSPKRRALRTTSEPDLMSKILTAIQRKHSVKNYKGKTVDFKAEVDKYIDEMIKSLNAETSEERKKYDTIIEGLQSHIVKYAEEIQTLESDITTLRQDNVILAANLSSRKKVIAQELQILTLIEKKLSELRTHYADHRKENRESAAISKAVEARNKVDNHQKLPAPKGSSAAAPAPAPSP